MSDWWIKKQRRIKRIRFRRGDHFVEVIDSRIKEWLWWCVGLVVAVGAGIGLSFIKGIDGLGWILVSVVGGLPLGVWFLFILPFHHRVRADRRDRTVIHSWRYWVIPVWSHRFAVGRGHLQASRTHLVERKKLEGSDGLGCLLAVLGPLGAIIQILMYLGRGTTKVDVYIPTLEWYDPNTDENVSLAYFEDYDILGDLLNGMGDHYPQVVDESM